MSRTVDTDVVVLAIAYARKLELQELWIAFGVGNHFRYLPIHKITTFLIQQQCETLLFFHAVTGCDTVSYFAGKGKKTAFKAWKSNPEVKSSVSYHLLKIRSLKNNVVPWSDLWLSCVAVRVPTRHGRVGLAAITRRMVSQVDYAS